MFIFYITAFLNGLLNSVNRMINVQAGRVFGTANGALINYFEATVLSLLLILLKGNMGELSFTHIASVPFWVYLGGVCGLIAMVLLIISTMRTNAVVGSVLSLVGNLGMALVLDAVFFDLFSLWRVLGLFLMLIGMTMTERAAHAKKEH